MFSESIKNIYQEKFTKEISDRSSVWEEIINESDINEEQKEKLLELINSYKNRRFTIHDQPYDVCRGLISQILTILFNSENEGEKALFENLRDDIWDMYKNMEK